MINIENLHKTFGDNEVLRGIDLTVNSGEVVVIIGPSGSGKSTFLRCLNLLEQPTKGNLLFEGNDLLAKENDIDQLRQKMGMVFQSFNLFPHMTVLENITISPTKVKGQSKDDANQKAYELLHLVGLSDKATSYPSSLSGGQEQRVAIARALAMDPAVMLFDEPTSALDPELEIEVLRVLQRLAHERLSMVLVTHNIDFARLVADRVIFLEEGKIEFDGPTAEFFSSENTRIRRFIHSLKLEV